MKMSASVHSYYWNKESNLLFDYDSLGSSQLDPIQIESDGKLAKNGRFIKYIKVLQEKDNKGKEWTPFLNFQFEKDTVSISDLKNGLEKIFISINHTFQSKNSLSGHRLKEGDCFKLGKISFSCKEIKIFNPGSFNCSIVKVMEKMPISSSINDNNVGEVSNMSELLREDHNSMNLVLNQNKCKLHLKSHLCRFCLSEEDCQENPFIAPCKCRGTMKHIHIECLKNWLKSKINTKVTSHMITYSFKQLMCELCLTPVPMRFLFKGKQHDLINMATPNCTYILLEQVTKEDSNRLYFIIMFKDKVILKIGRSNEADVRFSSDISISRHHSNLHCCSDGIYLEDNNSKFGSLIMLDIKVQLILLKQFGIQLGKHFFLITLIPSIFSRICCFK